LAVGFPAALSATAAPRKSCATAGRKTVLQTRAIRVYHGGRDGGVYACRLSRPIHPLQLLDNYISREGYLVVGEAHAAGIRVGIESWDCPRNLDALVPSECGGGQISSFDLGTRRQLRHLWTGGKEAEWGMTATGALACLRPALAATNQSPAKPAAVVVADASGEERVLDEGSGIETGSLAVSGRRVYWTSGGEARSAVLR
jgi:hypothetical protein